MCVAVTSVILCRQRRRSRRAGRIMRTHLEQLATSAACLPALSTLDSDEIAQPGHGNATLFLTDCYEVKARLSPFLLLL